MLDLVAKANELSLGDNDDYPYGSDSDNYRAKYGSDSDNYRVMFGSDSDSDSEKETDTQSGWDLPRLCVTDADRLAEKLKKEEEQTRINNIEEEIRRSIRQFIKDHPDDKDNLIFVYREHKKKLCYADISGKIGDHFRQQISRVDDAVFFYNLAYVDYTDNGSQSSLGQMYLDLHNREIVETMPTRPTASLYFHLKQAIAAFQVAWFFYMDESAGLLINYLLKIRNMILMWHLSAAKLQDDSYNGQEKFVKRMYARGFVNEVLQQAKAFRVFKNAKHYDGSMADDDLAKYLKDLGFYGVYQEHNQHNWVHHNGFMVRVKINNKGQTEFTIGLTFRNPIVWNADGTPHFLKQDTYGRRLVYDKYNEILKLAYDGKAVFVVPAFREFYWFDEKQVNTMMKKAHFPLDNVSFCYKTKALLTFQ